MLCALHQIALFTTYTLVAFSDSITWEEKKSGKDCQVSMKWVSDRGRSCNVRH